MELKFEGRFRIADVIKAYDFYPPTIGDIGKDPYHFIGTVINIDYVNPFEGWRGLEAVCTVDNGHGGKEASFTRVGQIVRVPYHTAVYDSDSGENRADRIQILRAATSAADNRRIE